MIGYTIEAAMASSLLDRTIVSTDDEAIAEAARTFGAEVPFLRPAELATSEARSVDVVIHALDWLDCAEGREPDYVVLLQPTSPLRTAAHIDGAIKLCLERDVDSVVSVYRSKHHPFRMKVIDHDGRLRPFVEVDLRQYHRRQDLPDVYCTNGAIYLIRSSVLRERRDFFTESTLAYVMGLQDSVDIDVEWDVRIAEMALKRRLDNG